MLEGRDALVKSFSLLRRHALAAPFVKAFQTQKQLDSLPDPTDGSAIPDGELMAIHYRDQEAIYVQASHDRVTVIFSTVFQEETDRIIGKVFLRVSGAIHRSSPRFATAVEGWLLRSIPFLSRNSSTHVVFRRFRLLLRCSTRIVTHLRRFGTIQRYRKQKMLDTSLSVGPSTLSFIWMSKKAADYPLLRKFSSLVTSRIRSLRRLPSPIFSCSGTIFIITSSAPKCICTPECVQV